MLLSLVSLLLSFLLSSNVYPRFSRHGKLHPFKHRLPSSFIMDESTEPAREGDLSTVAQALDSSAAEEPTKPTEAMTSDRVTANLGPTIPDQEHGEATKEGSLTSSPESGAKSRRTSPKYARVCFIDPVTPAKLEPKKSEVVSQTEHNVSVPTVSNQVPISLVSQIKHYADSTLKIEEPLASLEQEPNKHVAQVLAEADLGCALPKAIDFAIVTKKPENTTDTSGVKDGAVSEKAPQIGFKHDPDEEKVLANVELDDGSSSKKKKKKNKRRPKSQRGEV